MTYLVNARQQEKLNLRIRGAGGGVVTKPKHPFGLKPLRDERQQVPNINQKAPARRSSSRRISRTPPALTGEPSVLASPPKRQKLDHPISTATPLRDRPTLLHRTPDRNLTRSPERRPISQHDAAETTQGHLAISRDTAAAMASIRGETSLLNAIHPVASETPTISKSKKQTAVASVTPVRGAKRRRQPSPDKFLTPATARANISIGPNVAPPPENDNRSDSEPLRGDQTDENENAVVSKSGDDLNTQQVLSPVQARKQHEEVEVLIESPGMTPEDLTPTKGSVRRSTRRSPASNELAPSQHASTRISQQLTPETAEHTSAAEEETPTPVQIAVPAKRGRGRPPRKSQPAAQAEPEVAEEEQPSRGGEPEEEAGEETVADEETPSKAPAPKRRGRPPRRMLSLPPHEEDDSVMADANAPAEEDAASVSSLEREQSPPPDESVLPIENEAEDIANEEAEDEQEDVIQRRERQTAGRPKKGARQRRSSAPANKRAGNAASKQPESRASGEGNSEKIGITVYRPAQSSNFKQKFTPGVNAVDVVAQALQETVGKSLVSLQQRRGNTEGREEKKRLRIVLKAIEAFGDEAELQFMRHAQEYDNHNVLLNMVRRTEKKKVALSRELLDLRKQRELIAREMDDIRKTHELGAVAAENQRRLNQDFQALEGVVARGQRQQEKLGAGDGSHFSFPELGLGLSANIKTLVQDLSSYGSAGGVLEQVREFNKFLEAANNAMESLSTKQ